MKKKLACLLAIFLVLMPMTSMARYGWEEESPSIRVARSSWSNDRYYNWYMDQGDTGRYSGNNCGPTSVAMVMKWLNSGSRWTGESVRNWYVGDGGWWNVNIITEFFNRQNVRYRALRYVSAQTMVDALERGEIVLVCMTMGAISQNFNPDMSNKGRFYGYDSGHFLIVKGYKVENNTLYFQVYDPNNWGMRYANGQPMGKDRLYAADEMTDGILNWWNTIYAIPAASYR